MISFVFDQVVFGKTVRAVRRFAGLKQRELAARLHRPPRSYQHLEGGFHKDLDIPALFDIAHATGADPYAMLLAALMERPEIAVRVADNKLATAFVLALSDFNDVVGDDVANLSAAEIVDTFRKGFKDLAQMAGRPYPTP